VDIISQSEPLIFERKHKSHKNLSNETLCILRLSWFWFFQHSWLFN